ncbi:hypothetical protein V8E53_000093 [Lactarius tabidus]
MGMAVARRVSSFLRTANVILSINSVWLLASWQGRNCSPKLDSLSHTFDIHPFKIHCTVPTAATEISASKLPLPHITAQSTLL